MNLPLMFGGFKGQITDSYAEVTISKPLLNDLPRLCGSIHDSLRMNAQNSNSADYWKKSLRLVAKLLSVWFIVSFGCGILLKEQLDQFSIGGAPLGFWMAQQGSIICFVILLILYAYFMNKLDSEHGYDEEGE